ncbi:glycerophosphodiester phosphodiesterase [Flavobacterium pallidum]|uniref:Glycerophosphodiester phosphodiesterase n=1 Tax=Flavobacterium pallidum TaxID=2172098 RepID=A0A2S1SLH4_9FLAO|nr:glycerophosphodiester phosphodiesterase family protein [Flavobacterium pallidum]AWI27202.1 glycerophosphodiester phosphodiesterase [Flavobacterium pallidum]
MSKILKIGHRGAKGYAPENTLIAFEKAILMGCQGIELDVHLSADGNIFVIHDHTTDRVTGQSGVISALASSELKEMRIDGAHGIPLLSEVFDLVDHRALINIELKVAEAAEPVLRLIENYVANSWEFHEFLISSFDWTALQHVRQLHPEIPIGVLTETDLELAAAFAKTINAETIHPQFHLLNKENTEILQQDFKVFAWTANETEDIQNLKIFGVSAIITDFPDRI